VPRTLTVDNGKQFDSDKFKDFCTSIRTELAFTSVYHPESNGSVERGKQGSVLSHIQNSV
jgi:transposase InsO family protein